MPSSQINRRDFLKGFSIVTIASADISFKPLTDLLMTTEAIASNIIKDAVRLTNHLNQLNLEFYFLNVDLKNNSVIARYDQDEPYMIVRLPQQHIAETFIEIDQAGTNKYIKAETRISGYSFLVFRIIFNYNKAIKSKEDRQDFTLNAKELLDWNNDRYRLVIRQNLGQSLFHIFIQPKNYPGFYENHYPLGYRQEGDKLIYNKDNFPRAFDSPITALELPYGIILSPLLPDQNAFRFHWSFSIDQMQYENQFKHELWYARLEVRNIVPAKPDGPDHKLDKEYGVLSAMNLMMIGSPDHVRLAKVAESKDDNLVKTDSAANDKSGQLSTAETEPSFLPNPQQKADLVDLYIKWKLTAQTRGLTFTPFGQSTLIEFENKSQSNNEIELLQWKQHISLGRDEEVEVVQLAFDKETGLKMKFTETTRREFTKAKTASLVRHLYIAPLELFKDYSLASNTELQQLHNDGKGASESAFKHRSPFKTIAFASNESKECKVPDDPSRLVGSVDKPIAFWPQDLNGSFISFDFIATDWNDKVITISKKIQLVIYQGDISEHLEAIDKIFGDGDVKSLEVFLNNSFTLLKSLSDSIQNELASGKCPIGIEKALDKYIKEIETQLNVTHDHSKIALDDFWNTVKYLMNFGESEEVKAIVKRHIEKLPSTLWTWWDKNKINKNTGNFFVFEKCADKRIKISNQKICYAVSQVECELTDDIKEEFRTIIKDIHKKIEILNRDIEENIEIFKQKIKRFERKSYNTYILEFIELNFKNIKQFREKFQAQEAQLVITVNAAIDELFHFTYLEDYICESKIAISPTIDFGLTNLVVDFTSVLNTLAKRGNLMKVKNDLNRLKDAFGQKLKELQYQSTFPRKVSESLTAFATEYIVLSGIPAGDKTRKIDFFSDYCGFPKLHEARVYIGVIDDMVRKPTPVSIRHAIDFVSNQVSDVALNIANNQAQVVFEVLDVSRQKIRSSLRQLSGELGGLMNAELPADLITYAETGYADFKKLMTDSEAELLGLQADQTKKFEQNLGLIGRRAADIMQKFTQPTAADFFSGSDMKILGSIRLQDIIGSDFQPPVTLRNEDEIVYMLQQRDLADRDIGPLSFVSYEGTTFSLVLRKSIKDSRYNSHTKLENFGIGIANNLITIHFGKIEFLKTDKSQSTAVEIKKVEFTGALFLLDRLASIISTKTGVRTLISTEAIQMNYDLVLPDLTIPGLFRFGGLQLSVEFHLPLPLPGVPVQPMRTSFGLNSRDQRFFVSSFIFGGGGYFALEMSSRGVQKIDVEIVAGAMLSLDFVVASAEVYLVVGIAYRHDAQTRNTDIEAFIEAGGSATVLGFFSVSIRVRMKLGYYIIGDSAVLRGSAEVRVSIRLFFFKAEVGFAFSYTITADNPPKNVGMLDGKHNGDILLASAENDPLNALKYTNIEYDPEEWEGLYLAPEKGKVAANVLTAEDALHFLSFFSI